MGLNFTPRADGFIDAGDAGTKTDESIDLILWTDEPSADSRWPAGWWILPFAILGLVQCYFGIEWIVSQL